MTLLKLSPFTIIGADCSRFVIPFRAIVFESFMMLSLLVAILGLLL